MGETRQAAKGSHPDGKDIRKKKTRFLIAFIIGVLAGLAGGFFLRWELAPLIGWDSAAVILLYMLWQDFRGSEAAATETMVEEEDITYTTIDFIVLIASLISIGAVAFLLTSKGANFLDIGFGLFSIVTSWATVHALYTLRYAELYYKGVNGGIEFQGTEQPKISDFAYLAFTIGMTYQVSDTALTNTAFRKMALGHALLSFVFGTTIIATTINFIASLSR
ncbi:Hypothetical protein Tpal_1674 [Trichococcus palustris]|jgi:uncharacterized membrane protein|uniref:DUF1345 domain-containing protein n=1 Tax=Trichococcus palustris TaxID=140314 RepID=A0A143YR60_9LACT|nr:DUF1345 domain-containing protein [Trichococcus palustris]CZQ93711.1 Hypothetical protein Tpal_1674 [Trichococcus palustris]SFK83290.1 Uncharacterized membrane protein [Trichococcus palustris]